MVPAESSIEGVAEALGIQHDEKDNGPRALTGTTPHNADASGINEDAGRDGEYVLQEYDATGSDQHTAEIEYWEEVALEDGSVCFYNHNSQEYSPALPASNAITAAGESSAHLTNGEELQTDAARESGNDNNSGKGDGQMWDGADGEVFVPWPGKKPQDMRSSPEAFERSEEQPETLEDDGEDPFTPDDPAVVREQNLRALLVLLPAKVVKNVVKVAMEGAMLHRRRTATADAERRRRSLLSSRAQFRHTMHNTREHVPADSKSSETQDGGGDTDDELKMCPTAKGKGVEMIQASDSWRNTTTQERDTIVGHKLQEVLRVLYSTSPLEARLTMRAINLSSEGIGAAGAQELAPALRSCVIVALYLGNNAMGDKGVTFLADGLKHARGLQKLHLNDNEITDVGCHRLANALGPLKVLSTLDLCHNPFGDKACLALATYLCQPACPLQSLSVAGCLDVDPAAWKTIAVRGREGMGWDPPRPGDDGAVSLAAALMSPHGCPLRRLRMANVGMRTIGARAIAAALCANHTLETVDLSGNDFGCKADENAWENAVELLSFGLQVNRTVHTIVLRACGLTRQQVFGIQYNCSSRILRAQNRYPKMRGGGRLCAEADADGAENTGVDRESGRLPWREEKRLGFRAACLRDWLLDAVRVKGMHYPRPSSPTRRDTASFKTTSSSPRVINDTPAVVSPVDAGRQVAGAEIDSHDHQDEYLVEPRLWSGLLALRRLVVLHGSTVSLPSGWSSVDGSTGYQAESRSTIPQTSLLPQETEPTQIDVKAVSDKALALQKLKTLDSASDRASGMGALTRKSLSPAQKAVEHDGTFPRRAPPSSTLPSGRSQDPSSRATMQGGRSGGSPCPSDDHHRSVAADDSGTDTREQGTPDVSKETSPPIASPNRGGDYASNESEALAYGEDDPAPPETGNGAERTGDSGSRSENRGESVLQEVWQQEGKPISAADLKAAAVEGRRLASAAAGACKILDDEAGALSRERQSLRQQQDAFSGLVLRETSALKQSMADARAVRDDVRDDLRRLKPIAASARSSERAGKTELENFATTSLRRQGSEVVDTPVPSVTLEQLEDDFRERARHAQEMAEELREARCRVEAAERRTAELKLAEQDLLSGSAASDTSYTEKVADLESSGTGIHAKRAALRRTEKALNALAMQLERVAEIARAEETLRALVPAGSNRRDLDLQVAEAMRMTTKAARAIEQTRLRFDEASQRLAQARQHLVTTSARGETRQSPVLPAAAPDGERKTRAQTTALLCDEDAVTAENVWRLDEAQREADRDFLDAQARWDSAHMKSAMVLIRDHGDILRLKKNNAAPGADVHRDGLVQGGPSANRPPKGDAVPFGVQLNASIALGAEIALLRGSAEEGGNGNPCLPEIDDRFLTAGQRLRRLRDAREVVRRGKHKAYVQHSRQGKRALRARKRMTRAGKQASRIAQTLDNRQLVDALKERGHDIQGSENLDHLRRMYVEEVRPELRVRLHATARWTKSKARHRERPGTVDFGEIVARRQRALLAEGGRQLDPFP